MPTPKREPRAASSRRAKDSAAPRRPPRASRPARASEPATYNLYEAKTQLPELVDRAAGGEEIAIAKAGTPMARLTPLPPPEKPILRQPGGWEGQVWIADDFDGPQIFPGEWDDEGRLR